MQLSLGAKIRELRRRDGRTQEALAEALGVTSQAVSRWESGGSYPDMEIIPSLANYFGVSIDELFGYDEERTKRVDATVARIEAMNEQNNGKDICMDECIRLARAALVEFPGNERLTLCLASVLYNAGYVRCGEGHTVDEDGYDAYDIDDHRRCAEWREAILLYEKLLVTAKEGAARHRAVRELIQLYANTGETEKALALASDCPAMSDSREWMLAAASGGKRRAEYLGEGILTSVAMAAEQTVQCLISVRERLSPEAAAEALCRAISLFDCVCPNGEYGLYHETVARIYLYLSAYQWRSGARDAAFDSLNRALVCARAFECLNGRSDLCYSAPLFQHLRMNPKGYDRLCFAEHLPECWPFWCVPDFEDVRAEMRADPRWQIWVEKTKG